VSKFVLLGFVCWWISCCGSKLLTQKLLILCRCYFSALLLITVACLLCTTMHAIHNKRSPSPISQMLYRLRWQQLLVVVFDHLPLWAMSCRRHFSSLMSRPSWNRLPEHICYWSTPATFRRHLKMFLFAEAFNTTWNPEKLS